MVEIRACCVCVYTRILGNITILNDNGKACVDTKVMINVKR